MHCNLANWKKLFRCACAYLLLGAATTIAVAWVCGIWMRPSGPAKVNVVPDVSSEFEWRFHISRGFGITNVNVWAVGVATPGTESILVIPAAPKDVPHWNDKWPQQTAVPWYGSMIARAHVATGWPFRTLWCEPFTYGEQTIDQIRAGVPVTYATQVHRGFSLGTASRGLESPRPRVIPLGIIWSGFAANTVLYAIIWLLLALMLHAPRWLQRRRRRHRGVCLQCAYDLRLVDSLQCPECGSAREGLPQPQQSREP